jgi:AcrR family transcriptional regulator
VTPDHRAAEAGRACQPVAAVRRAPAKRQYLRFDERRRQLLNAAGRLFDRTGFGGITMVALSAEAGVSRQLVYDHFADVGGLITAFVQDRLARYSARPQLVEPIGSADATVAANFRYLLTIPASDRRIIHLIVADVRTPELDGARQLLLDNEWQHAGPSTRRSRPNRRDAALLWTTMSSLLSLADAVSNRQLPADEAETLAIRIGSALRV